LQYLARAAVAVAERDNELAAIPAAELSDSESATPEHGHLSQLLEVEGALQRATGFSQIVKYKY
jgi:hypothetical protein